MYVVLGKYFYILAWLKGGLGPQSSEVEPYLIQWCDCMELDLEVTIDQGDPNPNMLPLPVQ